MGGGKPSWSVENDTTLTTLHMDGARAADIANLLGTTAAAVENRRMKLKLPPRGVILKELASVRHG